MSQRRRSRRYVRERLSSPTSSIRLLTLDVENEKHFLAGSLGVFDLDQKSNYIAASYEWGEIEPEVDLVIDGRLLPIRHNLGLLLSEIRNRIRREKLAGDVRIWVDAVCIDQTDVVERGQQVSVMGQIFKSARGVFAWLGHPEGRVPWQTFEFITERSWNHKARTKASYGYQYDAAQQALAQDLGSGVWEMVLLMCSCRYWSRRWVVQELLLATDVTILCGDADVAWFYLMKFLHWIDSVQQPKSGRAQIIGSIKTTLPFNMIRYTTVGSESFKVPYQADDHSLMDLVTDFQGTECEVIHDKIYSLLSLSRERARLSIDYRCSPQDLVANLFIEIGWSKPEHVRTISTAVGLAETVPYSFVVHILLAGVDLAAARKTIVGLEIPSQRYEQSLILVAISSSVVPESLRQCLFELGEAWLQWLC